MNKIYLDYAATTPVRKEVLEAMLPYFTDFFYNPSSSYSATTKSRVKIEEAREIIASSINASPDEIYFTSGGSEGNSLAIKGLALNNRDLSKRKKIISSKIEHSSIMDSLKQLELWGFKTAYIENDKEGNIIEDSLKELIDPNTQLITVMMANNEIGTIQDMDLIGKICEENNLVFHTDAVAAYPYLDIDVKKLKIDILTISAHKLYGPKGIGALYIRKGLGLAPLISGSQERAMRGGTENVPNIVGFGKAVSLMLSEKECERRRLKELQEYFINGIKKNLPNVIINGSLEKRLINNISFSLNGIKREALMTRLDMAGIMASSGSACNSKSLKDSHVITAINNKHDSTIRFSLGKESNKEDISYCLDTLKKIYNSLNNQIV